MLFFLLFLSCTRDFFIIHDIGEISYEAMHDLDTLYYDDTSSNNPRNRDHDECPPPDTMEACDDQHKLFAYTK